MSSIILDLQKLATDGTQDITDLLRKAKLVATKLKLQRFLEWVDCELNGYVQVKVPAYRKIHAELKLKNRIPSQKKFEKSHKNVWRFCS